MERASVPKHRICRTYTWIHNGQQNSAAYILVGYCPDTLDYFNAMFRLAKKTFPWIKPSDVTCGKVRNSDSVKGFTVITFRIPPEQSYQQGWHRYGCQVDFSF